MPNLTEAQRHCLIKVRQLRHRFRLGEITTKPTPAPSGNATSPDGTRTKCVPPTTLPPIRKARQNELYR